MPDQNYNTGDGLTTVSEPVVLTTAPRFVGAIVRDKWNGHWFRWCHDAHSLEPWQLLHTDSQTSRWEDIPNPVRVANGVEGI